MANARLVVVVVTVAFVLYLSGIMNVILNLCLSLLLAPFSSFQIQQVSEAKKTVGPTPEEDVESPIDELMQDNQKKMSENLMNVVNMMENLVTNSDMDTMSDPEMEETFGKLYDMFPLMDAVFEKALKYEAGISINPRMDYHETHRRYEALRKILDNKREQKRGGGAQGIEEIEEERQGGTLDDYEDAYVEDEL